MEHCIGNLVISPKRAELSRNTEFFSKMDPYCVVVFEGQKQKTKVHREGGKTPKWSEEFLFRRSKGTSVKFEVWDFDHLSNDDLVGEGTLNLHSIFYLGRECEEWVSLTYKKKQVGRVLVNLSWSQDSVQFLSSTKLRRLPALREKGL